MAAEQNITDVYKYVFTQNPAGIKVLEDLSARFYDVASYTPGDPYHTAFKEGQRFVIRSILQQLAHIPQEPEDE